MSQNLQKFDHFNEHVHMDSYTCIHTQYIHEHALCMSMCMNHKHALCMSMCMNHKQVYT